MGEEGHMVWLGDDEGKRGKVVEKIRVQEVLSCDQVCLMGCKSWWDFSSWCESTEVCTTRPECWGNVLTTELGHPLLFLETHSLHSINKHKFLLPPPSRPYPLHYLSLTQQMSKDSRRKKRSDLIIFRMQPHPVLLILPLKMRMWGY